MSPPAISAAFTLDDAYYREHHREYVAALAPNTRAAQRWVVGFVLAAPVLGVLGVLRGYPHVITATLTASPLTGALWIAVLLRRRRSVWMRVVRELPGFGTRLRFDVVDGDLVQVKDVPGDARFERTGEIVTTPNGYLVRCVGDAPSPHPAIAADRASVYIPHRAITPPMSRDDFLAELTRLRVTRPS